MRGISSLWFTLFLLLPVSHVGATAPSFLDSFAKSLQTEFFPLKTERWRALAARVKLAYPSRLEDWGVINTDAAASYNDWLNWIVVKPDMTVRGPFGVDLATIPELAEVHGVGAAVKVSTLVHELAHAEFDLFVESAATNADLVLRRRIESEIRPWLKSHFPQLSWRQRQIVESEIFAYYRGDLLLFLLNEADSIIYTNGISRYDRTACQVRERLRGLEHFVPPLAGGGHDYRSEFKLTAVWVQGEMVDLAAQGFRDEWQQLLWDHSYVTLGVPRNRQQLLDFLNHSGFWRQRISACRGLTKSVNH